MIIVSTKQKPMKQKYSRLHRIIRLLIVKIMKICLNHLVLKMTEKTPFVVMVDVQLMFTTVVAAGHRLFSTRKQKLLVV